MKYGKGNGKGCEWIVIYLKSIKYRVIYQHGDHCYNFFSVSWHYDSTNIWAGDILYEDPILDTS